MRAPYFQLIFPKFSSGNGLARTFTTWTACLPGGCEEAAGGSEELPLSSSSPRLLWAVLTCTAAASRGPGDEDACPKLFNHILLT